MQKVSLFPDWDDPYLRELRTALGELGWECDLVGPKGLRSALVSAVMGKRTVHLHWYEGFNPRRLRKDGFVAWTYLPLLWLAGRRGRLIWTVHNLIPHEGYAPLVGENFVRMLALSASRILVHFEETRSKIGSEFGVAEKVVVTAPASFGHSHGPPLGRGVARRRVCDTLPPDGKLFVQFGNMRAYKDPATTVLAFRDAAPASARLVVAGVCRSDKIRADVLRAAEGDPRVILQFGFVEEDDLVALLSAADWSICPYRRIDNPGAANLTVAYSCGLIAPALPPLQAVAADHTSILYPAGGNVRKHLGDAIAAAMNIDCPPDSREHGHLLTTWRDQAEQTSAQYLDAQRTAGGP